MKKILIFLILWSSVGYAQINLDSLEHAVTTKKGKEKVVLLNDLCWYLGASAPHKAEKYGKEAVALSKELKNDSLLAQSLNDLGTLFLRIGEYDKAQHHYDQAIAIRESLKDSMGLAALYSKMAVIQEIKSNYPQALEMNLKVLKIYESVGNDTLAIATLYGNISVILANIGQVKNAIKYNDKALKLSQFLNNDQLFGTTLVNYANFYGKLNELDTSLIYYQKALPYFEKINNLNSIAVIINNMASIYDRKNQVDSSIYYYKQALEIRYQLQDKKGVMSTKSNLGLMYLRKENPDLALQYATEALPISLELETKEYTKTIYSILASGNYLKGNVNQAYTYQVKYTELLEVIFNEETSKQVAEMSEKYESEVKEKEIAILQKDKQLQQLEVGRLKTIRNIVIVGIILILLFSLILINRFVLIKRQKTVIEKQKDIVEEKQKEILDSIRYAKRIQDALLTSQGYIERNLKRLRN
ncbi:MAG: tetratricopeptide repeat protein [Bacteroidetes bacterium]|nr:tetratricopeptide repeat protein [Bacteroidota bacterium]